MYDVNTDTPARFIYLVAPPLPFPYSNLIYRALTVYAILLSEVSNGKYDLRELLIELELLIGLLYV